MQLTRRLPDDRFVPILISEAKNVHHSGLFLRTNLWKGKETRAKNANKKMKNTKNAKQEAEEHIDTQNTANKITDD